MTRPAHDRGAHSSPRRRTSWIPTRNRVLVPPARPGKPAIPGQSGPPAAIPPARAGHAPAPDGPADPGSGRVERIAGPRPFGGKFRVRTLQAHHRTALGHQGDGARARGGAARRARAAEHRVPVAPGAPRRAGRGGAAGRGGDQRRTVAGRVRRAGRAVVPHGLGAGPVSTRCPAHHRQSGGRGPGVAHRLQPARRGRAQPQHGGNHTDRA